MSKNKQEDIFEAAMILFAERGYDGTTIPMIADKAKVGAGTIYRYFDNKESLVNSLFVKCVLQFSDALKNNFPFHSTTREKFTHIFYRMFAFAKDNDQAFLFINSHHDGYYLNEKSKTTFQDFLNFIVQIIEDGKQKEMIRPLPSPALIAIVYGSCVMLFKLFQCGELNETPELLQQLEESSWNAIRVI
ncbi:TetR family transcriptional regulator [Shimazuella sp. AN120528]|uniref:TetR/AcrR family transcriptional regulator n=1 Tax=Shimazuella soli TaxID=1892854 RepID=UPI001F104498|nr:TetR/AcrR family transcriptional regulator [Shimazuella soli]MCH5586617.1 TetR family transcriptional regulator [Shimazuella soli]